MNDIIKIDNALPDNLDLEYKRNIFNCGWFIAKDIYDEQFKHNPGVVDDKNTFNLECNDEPGLNQLINVSFNSSDMHDICES